MKGRCVPRGLLPTLSNAMELALPCPRVQVSLAVVPCTRLLELPVVGLRLIDRLNVARRPVPVVVHSSVFRVPSMIAVLTWCVGPFVLVGVLGYVTVELSRPVGLSISNVIMDRL